MAHESAPPPWDVLAAELRAYRNQQQQTWGDLDSALIGRYLAGEASSAERERVEASFEQHPDLRVLTELVRDVLNEFEPAASPIPAKQPEIERPRILSFQPRNRKPLIARIRRYGALAAAACLLLALGVSLNHSGSVSDASGGKGFGDLSASRSSPFNDRMAMSKFAPGHLMRTAPPDAGKDVSTRSLLALAANVKKAHQSRSEETLREVAQGVDFYLAKVPREILHDDDVRPPHAVPALPPGGSGETGVKDGGRGLYPRQVLSDAAGVLASGI